MSRKPHTLVIDNICSKIVKKPFAKWLFRHFEYEKERILIPRANISTPVCLIAKLRWLWIGIQR